jgi:hypothetical protein
MGELLPSKFIFSHVFQVSTIGPGAVCTGDINRMCSQVITQPFSLSSSVHPQESRGGGTVCVTHPTMNLWNSFNNAITAKIVGLTTLVLAHPPNVLGVLYQMFFLGQRLGGL